MLSILLHPSTHAIMGSGDKLYDEGLCGALWVGGGGDPISAGKQTRVYNARHGFWKHR
jgi:hypothetical protein